MKKRTLLATATLTALVLSAGVLQPAPVAGAAALASHAQPLDSPAPLDSQAAPTVENPASPQWGAAFGFNRFAGFAWGAACAGICSLFSGPGGIACGIAGAA